METTIYSKYSNERAERFCIRTDIVLAKDGEKSVYKCAASAAGREHIRHILQAYTGLEQAYRDSGICFCRCEAAEDAVRFPYIEGKTLQDELELAVKTEDRETVDRILTEYIRRVRMCGGNENFEMTQEFIRIFGEADLKPETECANVSDIDMIFSNILPEGGAAWEQASVWNVIDYEWTFDFPIPKDFILYRALYFAYYQILHEAGDSLERLLKIAGITENAAGIFQKMEERFQEYLGKGALPVRNMQRKMGTKIFSLEQTKREEAIPESEWIKIRKLKYHIDRQEYQDGSVICGGWAFAKAGDGRYLPVNIWVTDAGGKKVPAELTRRSRRDVAEVLHIRGVSDPCWGFDCVWLAPPSAGWKIHFSLGTCDKVYEAGS